MGAALSSDAALGAVAGAIGGMVGEMVAEQLSQKSEQTLEQLIDKNHGKRLDRQSFEASYNEKIKLKIVTDISSLSAGVISLLLGQDVKISLATATNAVENNFIPAAIAVGFIAWEAYDLYCTAREEGYEAAAKQLGFDLVVAASGAYAGKRIYQLGKLVAPTASEAIQAYKHAHPLFAKLYDHAAQAIAKGIDKYKQLDAKLDKVWNATTSKVGEKIGQQQVTQQTVKQEIKSTSIPQVAENRLIYMQLKVLILLKICVRC